MISDAILLECSRNLDSSLNGQSLDVPAAWRLGLVLIRSLANNHTLHLSDSALLALDINTRQLNQKAALDGYLMGLLQPLVKTKKGSAKRRIGSDGIDPKIKSSSIWYPILCGNAKIFYHGSVRSMLPNQSILPISPSEAIEEMVTAILSNNESQLENIDVGLLTIYCSNLFEILNVDMLETTEVANTFITSLLQRIHEAVTESADVSSFSYNMSMLCQNILRGVLTAACEKDFPPAVFAFVRDISANILDKVLDLVLHASSSMREVLSKRLVMPLITILRSSGTGTLETTWHIAVVLARNHADLLTASLLMTLLINIDGATSLYTQHEFWWLVQACILHPDLVVRKRAAFAIDSFSIHYRNGTKLATTHQVRPWWEDFMDVYGQVEQCNSTHLVSQIEGPLERLFLLSSQQPEIATLSDNTDVQVENNCPILSFGWVKALLHIMLRAQLPTMRKAALHKLMLGRLPLRAGKYTVLWVFSELLPLIDDVVYFSATYFLGRGKDIGCYSDDVVAQGLPASLSHATSLHHPGCLLPLFLFRIMKCLDSQDIAYFCCQVANAVCSEDGLQSLSAAKWVVRCFSERCVQSLVPSTAFSTPQLLQLRQYLRSRLFTANDIVREQVLQGLLPLFLAATNVESIGLLPLVQVLVENVGIRVVMKDRLLCDLLFSAIERARNQQLGSLLFVSGLPVGMDSSLQCMASVLLLGGQHQDEDDYYDDSSLSPSAVVASRLSIASKLYGSPYLLPALQAEAIGFLHGFLSLVHLSDEFVLPSQLVRSVYTISDDLGSFVACSVQAAIAAPLTISTSLNTVGIFDMAVEVLGGLQNLSIMYGRLNTSLQLSSSLVLSINQILVSTARIADFGMDDPTSPFRLALAIRCSAKLLVALKRAWPRQFVDHSTLEQCLSATYSLCASLFALDERFQTQSLPNMYRSCVACMDEAAALRKASLLNDCENDSSSFSLLFDFHASSDHYSKFIGTMGLDRWTCIRAAMELLALAECRTTSNSFDANTSGDSISCYMDKILVSIADELEVCSMKTVPHLLGCAKAAIPRILGRSVLGAPIVCRLTMLRQLLSASWTSITGTVYLDLPAIESYIGLAFDPQVLRILDWPTALKIYNQVFDLGISRRPHIMQMLVQQLIAAWTIDVTLCVSFTEQICALLLYREQRLDDHSIADAVKTTYDACNPVDLVRDGNSHVAHSACRLLILGFLECLVSSPADSGSVDLHSIIRQLVAKNTTPEFTTAAMIGTDLFGEKLRCWQALCVLSPVVTEKLLVDIMEMVFFSLTVPCAMAIRTHMEIFIAALAQRFPNSMIPRLMTTLQVFNHAQQTLASLFVILGHVFEEWCDKSLTNDSMRHQYFTVTVCLDTVRHILPWLACGAGLPRAIALYIVHLLGPILLKSQDCTNECIMSLQGIIQHLQVNRDSIKMIAKQKQFFIDYAISKRCSVRGLSELGMDNAGEIVQSPAHLLDVIVDALKTLPRDGSDIDDNIDPIAESNCKYPPDISASFSPSSNSSSRLQTKRVAFDELKLVLDDESLSRQRNGAGRVRQNLIVCASLVDKVTNLAGIARTCEIFAVESLVVSSLAFTKTVEFKGIAVSADNWLPMTECPVGRLQTYLREMRQKGYAIVGLEQSDNSVSLDKVEIPGNRCVLLLGREKEGIPVELLQEIDVCIEIPQFGVIRSLNVHVSCALTIWELSKGNHSFFVKSIE